MKYRSMLLYYFISLIWISIQPQVSTLAVNSALSLLYQLGICGFGDLLWFSLADLARLGRAVRGASLKSYLQLIPQIFLWFRVWASAVPHKNLRLFFSVFSSVDWDVVHEDHCPPPCSIHWLDLEVLALEPSSSQELSFSWTLSFCKQSIEASYQQRYREKKKMTLKKINHPIDKDSSVSIETVRC